MKQIRQERAIGEQQAHLNFGRRECIAFEDEGGCDDEREGELHGVSRGYKLL